MVLSAKILELLVVNLRNCCKSSRNLEKATVCKESIIGVVSTALMRHTCTCTVCTVCYCGQCEGLAFLDFCPCRLH